MNKHSRSFKFRSSSLERISLRDAEAISKADNQKDFSEFKTRVNEEFKILNKKSTSDKDGDELADEDITKNVKILKGAYYSLLCAILDPTAHMRETHTLQLKSYSKITFCDECHSVLWGKY